ncbi:MAG TPA: GAF domain-containing protein, partial [Terriglobales bacterium]|nr:GAF domain-containing protein [Terriglobales bacterium]
MGRRRKHVRKPNQRRRTARPKLHKVATGGADLHEQLDRRTQELDDLLQYQMATSEVLSIIRRSPADAQPVFDAIVQSASRLTGAMFGVVYLYEDDHLRIAATNNFTPAATLHLNEMQQLKRPERSHLGGRAILDRKIVHVPDVLADPEYSHVLALAGGWRAVLAVPLIRDGMPLGVLTAAKAEAVPFSDRQIKLLETFADQAIIAIENTRRFSELNESLQQQTATADVLKVISGSAFELHTVLNTLVGSAMHLCEAEAATIWRPDGDVFKLAAFRSFSREFEEFARQNPISPGRGTVTARVALEGKIIHIPDVLADPDFTGNEYIKRGNFRSALGVPLLREGETVGVFVLTRSDVRPYTEKQIELVKTFADQAVIAIENTRLLSELRESLQQQTATSEVLKVISSSPGDLEPVFNTMLANATRICEAKIGILFRYEDGAYTAMATLGVTPAYAEYLNRGAIRPGPTTGLGRVASSKQTAHIIDTQAEGAYADREPLRVATAELGGARTLLNVPMLKEGVLVGAIGIYRQEVRPFTDKQIELVTNFAAQAVIAIENARLLNELRESLQQQTATSEVLKIISGSLGELKPVFQAMLEKAVQVCGAKFGILFLTEGDGFRTTAMHDVPRAFAEKRERGAFVRPPAESPLGRVKRTRQVAHVADITAEQGYAQSEPLRDLADLGGARTAVCVPMLNREELIGAITIYHKEVRPFTNKQIEVVTNFASQAV